VSKITISRLIIKYDDRQDQVFEKQILEFLKNLGFEKTASGYDMMQGMTDIELEKV
jgi:hypothetical protein